MTTFKEVKYQLNIKVLDDNLLKYYSSFINHHNGDSGIDLIIPQDINNIEPLSVATIDFQIQCEMIDLKDNTYTSYTLEPRSSISNTTFHLANSRGIIDAGYRGNIKAKVRNISFNNEDITGYIGNSSGSDENIKNKACLFQILSPTLEPIKLNIVDELSSTTRNDGGFGSTNKKVINN